MNRMPIQLLSLHPWTSATGGFIGLIGNPKVYLVVRYLRHISNTLSLYLRLDVNVYNASFYYIKPTPHGIYNCAAIVASVVKTSTVGASIALIQQTLAVKRVHQESC